jgi:hypothetical protein
LWIVESQSGDAGGAPMDGWECVALIVAVILWLMAGMMMFLFA